MEALRNKSRILSLPGFQLHHCGGPAVCLGIQADYEDAGKPQGKNRPGLEDARIASEARANAEKEARQIIAKAQAEANQKVREATERAESPHAKCWRRRKPMLAKIREDARAEVPGARSDIGGCARSDRCLVNGGCPTLVGEALDDKRQHTLN